MLSRGGIIPASLFPLDAGKTKDLTQSHRLSRCLPSSALALWSLWHGSLLAVSAHFLRVGRVLDERRAGSRRFSFLSFRRRPSGGSSARRAIDYIFPVKIETSFRLSIIDSSPFSGEMELQRERGYLFLKTQDDLGLTVILPPDIYTTRCGRAASRSLCRPLLFCGSLIHGLTDGPYSSSAFLLTEPDERTGRTEQIESNKTTTRPSAPSVIPCVGRMMVHRIARRRCQAATGTKAPPRRYALSTREGKKTRSWHEPFFSLSVSERHSTDDCFSSSSSSSLR